jgi:tRNA(fMet)-specific endonuclease VapC
LGLLIDSSVLIDLERRGISPATLRQTNDETTAISVVTVAELLFGLHRAATESQRARREDFIAKARENLDVLPFDLSAANLYARIWSQLVRRGERIGIHDLMIAATALVYDHDVLTHNLREFRRVPNLTVRQPTL